MDNLWSTVWKYSDYVKGAKYSASDFTQPTLITKLRNNNPKLDDVQEKYKCASVVGSAIHLICEKAMESQKHIDTEYKVKFNNISGTIDLVIHDESSSKVALGDWKTGSESNIIKKIKDPTDWIIQLSIYRLLYHKQEKVDVEPTGYIYWYATDKKKYGVLEIELISYKETIQIVKEFLKKMKEPIKDEPRCEDCFAWRHMFCNVKPYCQHWMPETDNGTSVDDW